MKVRLFGSKECNECIKAFILIQKSRVDFEYIDAMEDDTQDLCDENMVDELPHLQFMDNSEILMEHIGPITANEFHQYIIDYLKDY